MHLSSSPVNSTHAWSYPFSQILSHTLVYFCVPSLFLKARNLGGSAFSNFHMLEVPEQELRIPLGFGIVIEDNLLNFHIVDMPCICTRALCICKDTVCRCVGTLISTLSMLNIMYALYVVMSSSWWLLGTFLTMWSHSDQTLPSTKVTQETRKSF